MIARLNPEQRARHEIDQQLGAAGWLVQDLKAVDLTAGRGIAIREFLTAEGPCDYLLYVDGKAIGTIEAKSAGTPLSGFEAQVERYVRGFAVTAEQKQLPQWFDELPFHYLATGVETRFMSYRDPIRRPREIFHFHRPEALAKAASAEYSVRARLRTMPPVDAIGLRDIQVEAMTKLEESLRDDRERSLVAMTMGSGKTIVAIAETYRLLKNAGADRVLFLVDRINLGRQARDEFNGWVTPDDGRKFGELYEVQLLQSNTISPTANVVVTTIQRLYSMLRGDTEFDATLEEETSFDAPTQPQEARVEVSYQPRVPVELFDVIWTDECHRSIYGRWGSVLDYFDAFLVGLTATPSKFTYGYFNGNVVTEYTHEQSVIDGINVDYTVYRIKTKISEGGSTIEAGDMVGFRDRQTRKTVWQEAEDEISYDPGKLDRAVIAEDQLRLVIRTFKERLPTEIFPGRTEVPKTVVFCKNDSHAEDVVRIIREEFGRGSDFCRKITYLADGNVQQHIQDFRTDPAFRIAVSVDQIATGTDIRPIECLLFLRMVGSRSLFEQMKGRGVRRINPDDLAAVTPDAGDKDHFVIVDAVGVTDEDKLWIGSRPLDTKPSIPLKRLLQDVGMGVADLETVSSLGARLIRLDKRLGADARARISAIAGRDLGDIASGLIYAVDPDRQLAAALDGLSVAERAALPTDPDEAFAQLSQHVRDEAKQQLMAAAIAPLLKPEVRDAINAAQELAEQVIDRISRDELEFAGPVTSDQARRTIDTFEQFIRDHTDEYVALAVYFSQPAHRRLSYDDVHELVDAIAQPPYNLKPVQIWKAYEALDASRVKGAPLKALTDIVALLRFEAKTDSELRPFREVVQERYDEWKVEQEQLRGAPFTPQQVHWLDEMARVIGEQVEVSREDFDYDPFAQHGGLGGIASDFKGEDLDKLLSDLNEVLAAA